MKKYTIEYDVARAGSFQNKRRWRRSFQIIAFLEGFTTEAGMKAMDL
ncbi:MAG: hypothetical protein M1160_00370 [Candidatus Marsarchaeota archaeon]|jgi:hypothetical protein|nr:hypothetical protein [Candidatus Marsarchaeota archaeon]MCL5111326.1 hypothetical protein [Candidatus Marsarchaeota archaeon]